MAIYLKYGDITGDVTEADHTGWVECDNASLIVKRRITTSPGQGKNRESTAPSVGALVLTTKTDKTSPQIFELACAGKGETARIHFVRTTQNGLETYMEYILSNALVSHYSVYCGAKRPRETLFLNYTHIEMVYKTYDERHLPSGSVMGNYDIAQARVR